MKGRETGVRLFASTGYLFISLCISIVYFAIRLCQCNLKVYWTNFQFHLSFLVYYGNTIVFTFQKNPYLTLGLSS